MIVLVTAKFLITLMSSQLNNLELAAKEIGFSFESQHE